MIVYFLIVLFCVSADVRSSKVYGSAASVKEPQEVLP